MARTSRPSGAGPAAAMYVNDVGVVDAVHDDDHDDHDGVVDVGDVVVDGDVGDCDGADESCSVSYWPFRH